MNVHTPIKDMIVHETYHQVFYVSEVKREGEVYELVLADRTGSICSYISKDNVAVRHLNLQPKEFVRMCIGLRENGRFVIKTDVTLARLDSPPENVLDYVNGKSETELDSLRDEAISYSDMIRDEHYAAIIHYAIHDLDLLYTLRNSVYKLSGSLSFPGGLLTHTVQSLRFARVACKITRENETKFNPGLVIAGCFLRNIGWSTIVHINSEIRPRDACFLVGPNKASARFVNHLMINLDHSDSLRIPESKKQALENLCSPMEEVRTLEGRTVVMCNEQTDLLAFGHDTLEAKSVMPNWSPDPNGYFVGHHNV